MPPKKVSKSAANTGSSKSGAKTRSSAKSAPSAAAPSSDKKKTPTKSKKAPKSTEEESVTKDEGNVVVNAAKENDVSPESEEWELTIKMMRGNFTVKVPPTAGVMDLKEKIYEKQGFPVENQRLMFNSKIFTENHPLTVYDVTNGSQIYFVFRMCGI